MLLSPPRIAATLTSPGETEANSAGEQLAKGYPSRAVTDLRRGRPSGLPTTLLSAYDPKNSRRRRNESRCASGFGGLGNVAIISGKQWQKFPERAAVKPLAAST